MLADVDSTIGELNDTWYNQVPQFHGAKERRASRTHPVERDGLA